MTTPDERAFFTFRRGQIRDEMLAYVRTGLRRLVNPETGETFSEEEIRVATQPGSQIAIKFDAQDLIGQAHQQRARFVAQQGDPRRATSSWIRGYHTPLWIPDGALPVSPGFGTISWKAPPGAVFTGSTTPGDLTAFQASDPAGNAYQAFTSRVVPSSGTVELTMFAVVGGADTNPKAGVAFSPVANVPLGAAGAGVVLADFSGGFDEESDADLVLRIVDVIARRPASGNNAQIRTWARASSVSIENAWVYATALNAGTTIVAATQKRGTTIGPLARIPSDFVLGSLRSYLTPPGSPVVPGRVFILAHRVVSDPISVAVRLNMRKSTVGGWNDATPWPASIAGGLCRITALSSQTDFTFSSGSSLPGGASSLSKPNVPTVMAWSSAKSMFEKLDILSITDLGAGSFHVLLDSAPTAITLAVGSAISPYSALGVAANVTDQGLIATAVQTYFDNLGPGELFDLTTDPRGARAYRWPRPDEEKAAEADQSLITAFSDALGPVFSSGSVTYLSHSTPAYPANLSTSGPSLLTIQDFGAYAQ